MNIELKKVKKINKTDVLYDIKLKQFVVYPKVDNNIIDFNYIQENCLRLKMNLENQKNSQVAELVAIGRRGLVLLHYPKARETGSNPVLTTKIKLIKKWKENT